MTRVSRRVSGQAQGGARPRGLERRSRAAGAQAGRVARPLARDDAAAGPAARRPRRSPPSCGICAEAGVAITPQGGNTGLVGGQIPQGEILLSTERMRPDPRVDAADDVLVAEAGRHPGGGPRGGAGAGRRFPLDLASEGSATIGGLSRPTPAARRCCATGRCATWCWAWRRCCPTAQIWNGLKRLRKDNTGYDLKQLLIGAEGTLGVVTAAACKLFPIPASRAVAFVGLASAADAASPAGRGQGAQPATQVEAFELIGRLGVELAVSNLPGRARPARDPPALVAC